MLESIAIAMIEAGSDYEPLKVAIKATMTTKKSQPTKVKTFNNKA